MILVQIKINNEEKGEGNMMLCGGRCSLLVRARGLRLKHPSRSEGRGEGRGERGEGRGERGEGRGERGEGREGGQQESTEHIRLPFAEVCHSEEERREGSVIPSELAAHLPHGHVEVVRAE